MPVRPQRDRDERRATDGMMRKDVEVSCVAVRAGARERRRDALVVAFAVFVVAVACPVITSYDSRWVVPTAISIERHGDLNLDEYGPAIARAHGYAVQRVHGHDYDVFPWGTAVLVTPIVAIADRGAGLVGIDLEGYARDQGATGREERALRLLEHAIASLIVAVTTGVLFLVVRETERRRVAYVAAGTFALATSALSVVSRALWSHGPAMLMVSWALLVAVRARNRPEVLGWTGIPVAAAYVCRPTMSVAVVAFSVFVFVTARRMVLRYLAGAALVGVVFLSVNLATYHTLLPAYFHPTRIGSTHTFWSALAGTLMSPSRGLFVFSPVLIFALVGLTLRVRGRSATGLDVVAVAGIVGCWLSVASFPVWWGGDTYGPRLMADTLPFFCLLLAPFIEWCSRSPGTTLQSRARFVFAGLLFLSVAVHVRGAVDKQTLQWNVEPSAVTPSRVWDWGDSQILRGL